MASCSDTYYGCAGCMSDENVLSRVITARPELFHFIGHRAEYGWCRVATDLKKTSGAVLYAIKTAYKERLDAQMSTWASEVDHESLFIVGDWNSTSPNVLDAVGCSHDYHEGTLCKMGRLLSRVRHKMTGRPAITTRWVFIVDDDAYVDTANLEMALGQFDSERPIALEGRWVVEVHLASVEAAASQSAAPLWDYLATSATAPWKIDSNPSGLQKYHNFLGLRSMTRRHSMTRR